MEPVSQEQAFTDPLTGLYNRGYFFHVTTTLLNQAARYRQPLSLLLLDVDYLKQINSAYGRAFGDEVLKHLALNIRETIRAADVAARLEQDEFAVATYQTNSSQAARLAQRLQICVAENPMHAEQANFYVTLSVGVASFAGKDKAPSVQALLEWAERALVQAREAGGEKIGVHESQ